MLSFIFNSHCYFPIPVVFVLQQNSKTFWNLIEIQVMAGRNSDYPFTETNEVV